MQDDAQDGSRLSFAQPMLGHIVDEAVWACLPAMRRDGIDTLYRRGMPPSPPTDRQGRGAQLEHL